jgi:hypothetical protein
MDEHISVTDAAYLHFHKEFGDIMDDVFFNRVSRHVESCNICNKRYIHNGYKMIDIYEEIKAEMKQKILINAVKIIKKTGDYNKKIEEYDNYSSAIVEECRNKLLKKGLTEDESKLETLKLLAQVSEEVAGELNGNY